MNNFHLSSVFAARLSPGIQNCLAQEYLVTTCAVLLSATSILARRVAFPLLLLGAVLVLGQPSASAIVSFNNTGSLATARQDHTATLLPNGKVLVAGGYTGGNNGVDLASAELYDPASGAWTATGSLALARSFHSATLLPNGEVLVVGGYSQISSAELYDPASGTWTATGSLAAGRYGHTATLLPNGKVLVTGGFSGTNFDVLSSAELYDPDSGTWTATASLATARAFHTATLLPDGRVLIAGGDTTSSGSLASAEMYDPMTGTWSATGNLNAARAHHTATLLPNGKVLVAGGSNGFDNPENAEVYNPANGAWSNTFSLFPARGSHTATLLPNGTVLVAGGFNNDTTTTFANAQLYNLANGSWTTTGDLGAARTYQTATLLSDGKVLVAGGVNIANDTQVGTKYTQLASAELYDSASGAWTATGSLGAARDSHTATLLPSGKVLVAGGYNGSELASAELYDPDSGTWTATGSLATARDTQTATLLFNGKVLVAGGFSGSGILTSAELYDSVSGTWTATGSLGTARGYHTATLLPNGKVLVAGGDNSSGDGIASAELYDPASGTWTTTGSLTTARAQHTATLLPNGKVLVAGGFDSNSDTSASAELYDPASGTWTATGSLTTPRLGYTATLLPNGSVLAAGGNYGSLASAELYDPASGTWMATASLAGTRGNQTATLLPNGKVLAAGGVFGAFTEDVLASAELYDPVSGTWGGAGPLVTARTLHTATLLPNGKVLVVGGYDGSNYLASAEIYGVPAPPTLLNISTRMRVLAGEQVLIAGFIITGTDPKQVIIRGIGPSLNGVGVTLADPTLELHQGNTTLATNDDWKINDQTQQSQEADIRATTIPPNNDLESAIVATLTPGAYTAILAGKNGGTGVGLVEVYDLAQGANSKLANISTRGFVDADDNVMIGGLIIGGGESGGMAKVMVRALGPSLSGSGIQGALSDPTLELHDGNGTPIATNDNWKMRSDGNSQQAEIAATTIPPLNDLESALVVTLAPGNYTAIVRGKNNTTGVGLVEVYNVQ
jgi:N-acetylneuraminic acid mutarotase